MCFVKKSFIVLLLPLFLFGKQQKKNSNYISIDFAYEHYDKPVPTIVFNLDSFETNEYLFVGYRFKVNKQEFESLNNLVKTESSYIILDSFAVRYYDINIVKDGKKIIYGTVNFHRTKDLFTKILNVVRNSKDFAEISQAFKTIYTRIGPIK
jgi:hypothetical protein